MSLLMTRVCGERCASVRVQHIPYSKWGAIVFLVRFQSNWKHQEMLLAACGTPMPNRRTAKTRTDLCMAGRYSE